MDSRPCTAADLTVLTEKWPVPGGVHEAHASNAAHGSSDYLVAWRDGEPLDSAVIRWTGFVGAEGRVARIPTPWRSAISRSGRSIGGEAWGPP